MGLRTTRFTRREISYLIVELSGNKRKQAASNDAACSLYFGVLE